MKGVDISAGAILLLSVIYFFGGMTSLVALLFAVSTGGMVLLTQLLAG